MYALAMASALTLVNPAWGQDCDTHMSRYAPTPTTRYVITGGKVYDQETHLTWQRCSVGQQWKDGVGCVGTIQQLTWDQAMNKAGAGWRVPTVRELRSLVSLTCKNPWINEEAFPNMELDKLAYWSSNKVEDDATHSIAIYFDYNQVGFSLPSSKFAVRLVGGVQ